MRTRVWSEAVGKKASALARRGWGAVAVAAVVISLFGGWAEHLSRELYSERARLDVLHQIGIVRAKLEGNINGNIALVRGLAATISTEPDMDQARFAELARSVLENRTQTRHIAAAPDLVVSMIHPLAGNEKALGLDYRKEERQREAVYRARDTGQLVLAGPVELRQGGRGFIARIPTFSRDENGRRRFWGIVSAVIDADRLYLDSGLLDPLAELDIAIRRDDGKASFGQPFFGSADVLAGDPVFADIALPDSSWQLAAVPRDGWSPPVAEIWMLRLVVMAAGAIILVPMLLAWRLADERRRHLAELQSRAAEAKRLSHRLRLALDTSRIGVWELDLIGGQLVWDDRMNELYGYPADGRLRTYADWECRIAGDSLRQAQAEFQEALETRSYHSRYRIEVEGIARFIRAIGSVIDMPDGSVKFVGVNWDVTAEVEKTRALSEAKALTDARNVELELARARIEHNALHDFLTSLPNRMYLEKVLAERAAHCRTNGRGGVVLLQVDLDRFKEINDTLGHAAGDAMLVHVAETIRAELHGMGDGFVARIGGDEFVIVCPQEEGLDGARGLADRLIEAVRTPVLFNDQEIRFGISVGIASAYGAAVDPRQLLVNADVALYRAKNLGRNRCEVFTPALHAELTARKHLGDAILRGLENGEFIPFFQPQFDARSLKLTGVEALARWRHPVRGLLAPDQFIAVAQEIGVIDRIDAVILEQGLASVRSARANGIDVPRLSVNVSARRLHDERLVLGLGQLGLAPGELAFELVESIYLDDQDARSRANIEGLRALGIEIEIDDFGTGYASIVSLMQLKPQRLKIDRQLVQPILNSPSQQSLIRSIVEIGRSLGIGVVAEGVETMEHARLLRTLGCDDLQGYALARPMAGEDLIAFARRSATSRWG